MKNLRPLITIILITLFSTACRKKDKPAPPPPPPPPSFSLSALRVDHSFSGFTYYNTGYNPEIRFSFSAPVNRNSVSQAITFVNKNGGQVGINASYSNNDSTVIIKPNSSLLPLTQYAVQVSNTLKNTSGGNLQTAILVNLTTKIDSTNKFPIIPDEDLLTLVQEQTFKYFWDFAHPVSGLARERNSSGDVVTTGGSGFGIMAIITGIHRNFITRQQGLQRMQTIVGFLKNNAAKFKGAFPHWLNGSTGAVIPFSTKDNGADLVETSFLMQGLLCARQYFDNNDAAETQLRDDINSIWEGIEWNWFRKNNENVLYWHWSPNYNWEMNLPIRGWNETLVTYVLAASSPTHHVPASVYHQGFARNGAMVNGNNYYGIPLPLGPQLGGPLFFEHYSFLGIDPNGLTDQYADYEVQTKNHTLINRAYCIANPKNHFGYSEKCWGLTASDIPNGYTASSPTNDVSVIAPTAAISSMPYTPGESMEALKFFYYTLGDKLWGPYGFYDAFSLHQTWFADSYLAIDQGPIVVMIENHRSGLLWDLFMSCPEIKSGLQNLGFQSPHL